MRKTKKIVSLLAAIIMMVSIFALPANAANTTDTDWTFNFNLITTAQNSPGRAKQDSSGTYVKASKLPSGGFRIYVDGKKSDGSFIDCTSYKYNTPYLTVTGSGRCIRNYVYENGYRTARLGGYVLFGSKATGVWSPDTKGSYTYLN